MSGHWLPATRRAGGSIAVELYAVPVKAYSEYVWEFWQQGLVGLDELDQRISF